MVRITKLANRWALSWVRNDQNSWWQRWHPRRCSSCPKKEMCCLDLQFAHICAEDLINNKRSTSSQTHSRVTHTQGDVQSKIVSNPYDSAKYRHDWEEHAGQNKICLCCFFLPCTQPGSQLLNEDATTLVHSFTNALSNEAKIESIKLPQKLKEDYVLFSLSLSFTWNMIIASGIPITE